MESELLKHFKERANIDKDVALSLQKLELVGEKILEQTTRHNGRLTKIEARVSLIEPSVNTLLKTEEIRKENKKWWNREMIIKVVNIAGVLAVAVLVATGILTLG